MALPTVDANKGQMIYNNPAWSGANTQSNMSSIGKQIRLDVYIRKALEEAAKEQYFSQMSGTYNMPKHMGKTVKKFFYVPLLDDANTSTQGIDAAGTASTNAGSGHLYGSTKDAGVITSKLPTLTEVGGRVNRVGFTRKTIESSIHKLGFFYEFTQESLDFDSDAELLAHMGREAILGANEITEDMLGIELIKGAGVKVYGGEATSLATMDAETIGKESVVDYKQLQRLAVTLKENRAPNRIKAIRGTRIVDTKIIGSGYALYIGYPLENQLRNMKDAFDNQAFIPVEKYAQSGNALRGEIGTIGQFRIVVAPEMVEFNAAGKEDVGKDNAKYVTSAGYAGNTNNSSNTDTAKLYYDVFPMLAVASEAFTVIGFQTGSAGAKFKMHTKMPGAETADRTDPYGESGFSSIKWYHGTLIERPEWIAVAYTLAEV